MSIRVTVTQEGIDNGVSYGGNRCPLALALQKRFPDDDDIVVLSHALRVNNSVHRLSERAVQFVEDFDAGKPVQPSTFVLK